jgi:5'(3')-deoxyribonucleotidase
MNYLGSVEAKQSERVYWVIQTVFGYILARSFYTYGSAFLPPIQGDIFTLTLALCAVYGCVLWSWIDFSHSLLLSPYNFKNKPLERYRFASDLFIVLIYTYLLLYVDIIKNDPSSDLTAFIGAFALVFLGYTISGLLRIIEYGTRASRIFLILFFLLIFVGMAIAYHVHGQQYKVLELNRLYLLLIIAINEFYRVARSWFSNRTFLIGVDVDGVLANQVIGVLPIIKDRYGQEIDYGDVTDWRLPVGDTSIDKLIVEELKQKPFVINMPLHLGAKKILTKIARKHKVAIATARSAESNQWTMQWLKLKGVPFDDFYSAGEGGKHNELEKLDIFIDDHEENIISFLNTHVDKSAVLFSQPWNSDRKKLSGFFSEGRLAYVNSWEEIPGAISNLLKSMSKAHV